MKQCHSLLFFRRSTALSLGTRRLIRLHRGKKCPADRRGRWSLPESHFYFRAGHGGKQRNNRQSAIRNL